MKTADKQHTYEVRLYKFLREIMGISAMKPKEKYLHRLMDGVPFQDLETAILMTHIEREGSATNDNIT
jgi:hypothetical protein